MKAERGFLFVFLFLILLTFSVSNSASAEESGTVLKHGSNSEQAIVTDMSSAHAMNMLLTAADASINCGTPLLFTMLNDPSRRDPSLTHALQVLIRRPSLREESVCRTMDGNFLIHYTRNKNTIDTVPSVDTDRNGIPDYVDLIGDGLEEAQQLYVDTFGFQSPAARFSPGQPYDVYIVDLGGSATGATVPILTGKLIGTDQIPSFMLIDNMILDDATILKASAAHQYAHAITLAYSYRKEPWWAEATAIWLEDRLYHTLPRYLESLDFRLSLKGKAFDDDNLKIAQGNALWAFFLGEKDRNLVRKIWEEIELFPENTLLDSFSTVLEREGEGSLRSNFSDYSIWSYFTGNRNDGNHFLFADLLADPVFESSHSLYPVPLTEITNPIESLGASFVRFESEMSRGALIVDFEGDQSCQWDVDLLLVSDVPPMYLKTKMSIDPSGRGSIGIPWQSISEVIMIVKNMDCEERSSGRYTFTASHDPSYPFALQFFKAAEEQGNIALSWETGSEENLYGWNIYRSTEPEQSFSRINTIIIPALGDSSNEIIYTFIDNSAHPSVRYYYYIEGITMEGLPSRSSISSAHIEE